MDHHSNVTRPLFRRGDVVEIVTDIAIVTVIPTTRKQHALDGPDVKLSSFGSRVVKAPAPPRHRTFLSARRSNHARFAVIVTDDISAGYRDVSARRWTSITHAVECSRLPGQ